jgi:hypothetical protein
VGGVVRAMPEGNARARPAADGRNFVVVPLSIDRGGRETVAEFYAEIGIRELPVYTDTSGEAPPMTFDLTMASSYNPAFVTAEGGVAQAEAALETSLLAGETYINIHTTGDPTGEIRGFLSAVPEPSTWALMLLGFAGLGFAFRQSRRTVSMA